MIYYNDIYYNNIYNNIIKHNLIFKVSNVLVIQGSKYKTSLAHYITKGSIFHSLYFSVPDMCCKPALQSLNLM